MAGPERITITAGTMINLSMHEDDDFQILTRNVEAEVLGPPVNHALPVRIRELDNNRTYFLHQPEERSPGK